MSLLQRSHSAHTSHPNPLRQHPPSAPTASPADSQNVISALLSENLQSPNAIPPRTSSSSAVTNGHAERNSQKPSKRASTSVLRPISETDWLSQGKRVSQEVLRQRSRRELGAAPSSPPPNMDGSREGLAFDPVDTVPGTNHERDLSEGYGESLGSPKSNPVFQTATPITLPQRRSSRHRLSSSLESNKSSSRTAAAPRRNTLSPPPPPERLQSFTDDLTRQRKQPWSPDKERILLGPYAYLLGHPGKDIRATMIAAFNEWLKVPEGSLVIITRVIGMLHTASLLVDDVEDSSILRRGVPVAHSIFGTAQTINSANYVYFLALQELTTLPSSREAIQIYTEELLNLHRGQGLDLFWRDTLTCPSEADYLEMVGNKTGGLFRLAIRLMQAESRVDVDCVPLVNTIGLLFQILDDHLNLSSSMYTARKGLCEDLTEGKFSFPVIHAIRADPQNLTLINILRQKTGDEEVKRYAVSYMERMGSFTYSREMLDRLRGRAEEEVSELEVRVGVGHADGGKRGADGMRKILEKLRVDE